MALVSSCNADLRIYEPLFSCEYSSREEEADHRSRLLAKIHSAYSKALERLAVKGRPLVAACFLSSGGFCFGLLDPASNIVVNTLIPCKRDPAAEKASGGEEDAAGGVPEAELKDLELRSLDGMVTFLTRFFPYLADCEAVLYLLLADADLLLATRIIVMDRRMKRFGSSEPAVEEALLMALKCAALAARHPDADGLVGAWLTVTSRLDEVLRLLAKGRRRSSSSSLDKLIRLLNGPALPADGDRRGDLSKAWQLSATSHPHPRAAPYQNTSTALKRALLDAIHGFYLQALARLPPAGDGDLRPRLHRSLLMAGHCYGPLDPVSNILLNTIWFDAAFPPAMKPELDSKVIATDGLHRIGTRSMYGLISFLCTRYHHLKFHRAARRLLEADGNLLLADPNLDAATAAADLRMEEQRRIHSPWSTDTGFHNALGSMADAQAQGSATASVHDAFKAAATAAWHPNPNDQATLLTSCKPMLGFAMSLLQGGDQLTSEDIQRLARLLVPADELPCQKPLVPSSIKEYARAHTRILREVNAALSLYAPMPNGEPAYEIHAICGVNEQVSGPVYDPESGCCPPEKFYSSHVNFLASPRGTNSHAHGAPVLFFAEISNDDEGEGRTQPFCCPVLVPPPCAERVRCLYCDYVGTRIIHPIGKNFHGREEDFEMMVCGKDPYDEDFDPALMPQYYTNMSIIGHSKIIAERIGGLEEDRIFSESDDDSYCHYTSDEC